MAHRQLTVAKLPLSTDREGAEVSNDARGDHDITNDVDNLSIKHLDGLIPSDFFIT